MKTRSSFYNLNSDKKLNLPEKLIWIFLNFLNNNYFPNKSKKLCLKNFCPEIDEKDWKKIHVKSSPSRTLSDLFWLNLDWDAIRSELGNINIFDTGAGKGGYALKLNDFAGGITRYFGVDYSSHKEWEELMSKHKFVTMKQHDSNAISDIIPSETNFFMSQSAIEHFENDLLYFKQIRDFIGKTNTIQVHLFPSAAGLKLYRLHGVRQYTPRTVSKIVRLFNSPNAYSILYRLGGENCNRLHHQFITRPLCSKQNVDFRDTRTEEYRDLLRIAVDNDIERGNKVPSFYALVIHSNFKRPVFQTMGSLTKRCNCSCSSYFIKRNMKHNFPKTQKLALFFTRGISLKDWCESGLIDREKLIFEEHLKNNTLETVYWLTYGSDDPKYAEQLHQNGRLDGRIKILSMPKIFRFLGVTLYSVLAPFIYYRSLKSVDILKTNQMDGSWTAVIAKWITHKKLVLRTGYTESLFLKKKNSVKKYFVFIEEKLAYKNCDIAIVASYKDEEYISSKYKVSEDKLFVLHNYIDINLFKPMMSTKYESRMVFVGRLNQQKNLFNLVDALANLNLKLDIYGAGEVKDKLEQYALSRNVKIKFNGLVPNKNLPQLLNKYKYYILPSLYEGMPKTLLEAMACGLICIGTNVVGINEVIGHNKNGILASGTDANSIIRAIELAINSEHENLKKAAVKTIEDKFSLTSIAKQESKLFKELLK